VINTLLVICSDKSIFKRNWVHFQAQLQCCFWSRDLDVYSRVCQVIVTSRVLLQQANFTKITKRKPGELTEAEDFGANAYLATFTNVKNAKHLFWSTWKLLSWVAFEQNAQSGFKFLMVINICRAFIVKGRREAVMHCRWQFAVLVQTTEPPCFYFTFISVGATRKPRHSADIARCRWICFLK